MSCAGLATTTVDTGQQWDYPNGWPPLQHMTVEGLDAYGGPEGKRLARQLARSWIR
jgi:alpha,alpha-trehalase